jgi:hypothetical protein
MLRRGRLLNHAFDELSHSMDYKRRETSILSKDQDCNFIKVGIIRSIEETKQLNVKIGTVLLCRLVRSFKLDLVHIHDSIHSFLNDFFLSLPSNTRYSNPATSHIPLQYYYRHYYTVQVLNKKVSR